MATSPNYGWSEPDNTSLVKDGAQAMRTLGDAIDTSVWNVGFGQAGKNKVINGDFSIWQRGTSFNPAAGGYFYTADRWQSYNYGTSAQTVSRQAFTAGTAPVAGYESTYFLRATSTNTAAYINQPIEDVRTFAGKTVTLSFWAKTASNQTVTCILDQYFGAGGSTAVYVGAQNNSATTSWQRFSWTVAVPSIAGKTIGTGNYLALTIRMDVTNVAMDIWGVQLEAGSIATPFQTASGGSIQSELAMCQRYYWRNTVGAASQSFANGLNSSTFFGYFSLQNPVQMRARPTAFEFSGLNCYDGSTNISITPALDTAGVLTSLMNYGGTGFVANRPVLILSAGATSYVALSAEL